MEEPIQGDLLEPGTEPPFGGDPAPPADPAPTTYLGEHATREEAEAAFAQTQTDLREAQERESVANARAEEANRALMTTLQTAPARVPEPLPEPLGPAPNPADDPEGYAAHTRQQIERGIAAGVAGVREEVNTLRAEQGDTARRQQLWGEFQRDYPEYAGMEDAASIAFLQACGGRIPADTAKLKRDVKARLDKMRTGFLPGDHAEAAGGSDPPTPPEATRTAGLGAPSRTATPKADPKAEKIKGLTEQLGDVQEKSGFF